MVTEYNYINIREVLSRLNDHPLLSDLSLERVIRYTIDFIAKMGMPKLYQDKEAIISIEDWRGELPCDLISIIQVKDTNSGICLRAMTDNFMPKEDINPRGCEGERFSQDLTFKTQGRVIYTSFKTGSILISYKSIPVDEDGFPMLIDNPVFIAALEAYIKKQAFTILFDMGKINQNVLTNTQQEYSWLAGQCQSEFTVPSISEMESIKNMWTSMIQNNHHFYNGFKNLGVEQQLRVH